MAESGPSQRKISVSTLLYSTLGPGISLLPTEVKDDPSLNAAGEEETLTAGGISAATSAPANREARPQRSSAPGEIQSLQGNPRADKSSLNSNGDLERLYTSPASSFGQKGRLGFKSKAGAGSVSSMEQATLPTKQDGGGESLSPVSPVSKQLQTQMALGEQPLSPSEKTDHMIQHTASSSGLIPRAPTGSDWSRSTKDRDDSFVDLSEILKDLDRQAGEKQHRDRVYSLQKDTMIGKPISWLEDAISNRHLWQPVDSREACHLAETQYCQQMKLFNSKRQKLKCTACKVLVHDTCVKQLYYEGYCCKETFREIKQKVKDTSSLHHFLHRRKAGGRCKKCDKGFGNWRKFNLRDIVGISCSWCGDSYHESCFNESSRREPCHMGPLRNLIIPPSWIVKLPPVEQASSSGAAFNGSSETSMIAPKGTGRRRTRRSKRKKSDDRASKYFTVKPISTRQHKPLLVFINPKSGGNQGAKLMQTFQWLLNPRQVFDLSEGGPEFGLKMFQNVSNIRVLACGGDGTAGWILSILDKLDIRPSPPIAILPLGTGNDLARVFGWGAGYTDEPLEKILLHVEEGPVEEMDRWSLNVWENPRGQRDSEGADNTPLHVINNYFSIGADAQVALEFHLEREANPEKFSSRSKNKFQYTKLGGKDIFLRRFATLTDHIKLYGDGEDLTERIQSLKLEAICFLNIPSYGAGTNAWGNPSSRDRVFKPQMMDDGKIEIVGFWSSTFPMLHMGAHGERIAQCMHVKLVMNKAFPVQIDGEAVKLQPSVIEVALKKKASMVRKVPRRHPQAPLQGVRPSDRIKLSVSKVSSDQYDRLHSDLYEIRRCAKALGLVVATAQDTLSDVRQQIEPYSQETDEDGEGRLSKTWRFLDVANSGRVDRMFQVTPDQEKTILIGDMVSDGLLIVELLPSPASTPAPSCMPVLMHPGGMEASGDMMPGDSPATAAKRRKAFGRNTSYEVAVKGISPPPSNGTVKNGLEVPSNPNLNSDTMSPLDTPVPSDEEPSLPLPNLVDTGSDSNSADTDTSTNIQKSLLDSVKRGNLQKVKSYHGRGANLLETDQNGWTPLHHAARLDKVEVVKYIIENIPKEGLDIVEDEKIQTALHKAAWYGHVEVCKALVESGASMTRKDYQGNNVHDKSVQSGNTVLQGYLQDKMKLSLGSDEVAV